MKEYKKRIEYSIPTKNCLTPILMEAMKDENISLNEMQELSEFCMCRILIYSTFPFVK